MFNRQNNEGGEREKRVRESISLSIQKKKKASFCAGMRLSELILQPLWANNFLNSGGVVCFPVC